MMMNKLVEKYGKIKTVMLIVCIALAVTLASVAAINYLTINSGNSVTNTVVSAPSLTVALDGQTTGTVYTYVGDTLVLTATLSDGSSGVVVTFLLGSTPMGTATTVSGGVATYDYTVTASSGGVWSASAQWPIPGS